MIEPRDPYTVPVFRPDGEVNRKAESTRARLPWDPPEPLPATPPLGVDDAPEPAEPYGSNG
ncbi:MAG: hypothetical protein ABR559_08055, partial [Gemmatimonadota bacterium]